MNTLPQLITAEISIQVYEMEVSPFTSFAVMAMSMITFFILNALIDKLPIPSKYAERSSRHKWRNVLVSTVHAVSGTIGGFARYAISFLNINQTGLQNNFMK